MYEKIDTNSIIYPKNQPPGSNNKLLPEKVVSRVSGASDGDEYTKTREVRGSYEAFIYLIKDESIFTSTNRIDSEDEIRGDDIYTSKDDIPDFDEIPSKEQRFHSIKNIDKQPCDRCDGELISECQSCDGKGYKKCTVEQCDGGILYKDCSNCGGERADTCNVCDREGREEFGACRECSGNDYRSERYECGECEGKGQTDCECENGYQRRVQKVNTTFTPKLETKIFFNGGELDKPFEKYAFKDFSRETYEGMPTSEEKQDETDSIGIEKVNSLGTIEKSEIDGEVVKSVKETATLDGYELEVKTESNGYSIIVSEDIISKDKLISGSSDYGSNSNSNTKSANSNVDTSMFSTPDSWGSAIIQFFKHLFISAVVMGIIFAILSVLLPYLGVSSPLLNRVLGLAYVLPYAYAIFAVFKN